MEVSGCRASGFAGGGRVTETEVGAEDEEGYREVEVTMDNGSKVDVHLDIEFNILGREGDQGEERK